MAKTKIPSCSSNGPWILKYNLNESFQNSLSCWFSWWSVSSWMLGGGILLSVNVTSFVMWNHNFGFSMTRMMVTVFFIWISESVVYKHCSNGMVVSFPWITRRDLKQRLEFDMWPVPVLDTIITVLPLRTMFCLLVQICWPDRNIDFEKV
jgi:hypothetical protein